MFKMHRLTPSDAKIYIKGGDKHVANSIQKGDKTELTKKSNKRK
jgi:hypothetical protein